MPWHCSSDAHTHELPAKAFLFFFFLLFASKVIAWNSLRGICSRFPPYNFLQKMCRTHVWFTNWFTYDFQAQKKLVNTSFFQWLRGESNPWFQRERLASWPLDHGSLFIFVCVFFVTASRQSLLYTRLSENATPFFNFFQKIFIILSNCCFLLISRGFRRLFSKL